jgi:hypothetical protein
MAASSVIGTWAARASQGGSSAGPDLEGTGNSSLSRHWHSRSASGQTCHLVTVTLQTWILTAYCYSDRDGETSPGPGRPTTSD